jgi:2-furoate---CoA ligase
MLDLGTSFLASVARDPHALAIVDGDLHLTYTQWYRRMSAVVAGFEAMGLKPGDRLVTLLQNRWEAATIHWACQLAGIVITPVNWRAKLDEVNFYVENAEAKAIVYESASAEAVAGSTAAKAVTRIALDQVNAGDVAFSSFIDATASDAQPRASADAWSVMLYTSGTTAHRISTPMASGRSG